MTWFNHENIESPSQAMNSAFWRNPLRFTYTRGVDTQYADHNRFLSDARNTANELITTDRTQPHEDEKVSSRQLTELPIDSGLNLNSQQLVPETAYNTSPFLPTGTNLDVSHGASIGPLLAPYTYGSAAKSPTSNAVTSDPYTPSSIPYEIPSWSDNTMTDLNSRLQTGTFHPLSTFRHLNGITGHYFSPNSRPIDPYTRPYAAGRPFISTEVNQGLFPTKVRSPNSVHLPTPVQYHTTGVYPSMPQNSALRPDGPPFEETKVLLPLVNSRSHSLVPDIDAGIYKGFFQVEGNWTCYRRNYFSVTCGFTFKHGIPESPVYLQRHSSMESIQSYAVSISAKTVTVGNQESETRALIQHTPKRDKATETVPSRHLIQPAPHHTAQYGTNFNGQNFYANSQHVNSAVLGGYDAMSTHNQQIIPTSYTFERIQFQKATANNGKRRAQQQFFQVVVELSVKVESEKQKPTDKANWVLVATRQSHPMVVRGRSPGHYRDNVRRDGQTHMDPDRGAGSRPDGASGPYAMPPMMGNHPSNMEWSSTQRGHGQQFGNGYFGHGQMSLSPSDDSSPSLVGTSSPFLSRCAQSPSDDHELHRLEGNMGDVEAERTEDLHRRSNIPCSDELTGHDRHFYSSMMDKSSDHSPALGNARSNISFLCA